MEPKEAERQKNLGEAKHQKFRGYQLIVSFNCFKITSPDLPKLYSSKVSPTQMIGIIPSLTQEDTEEDIF